MHLERSSWRCVRDACRPRPCGPFLSSGNAGVIVTAAAVPDLGRCAVRGVVRCSCWGCMYILLLCCLSVSRLLGAVHCLYVHKSFACLCPVSCHALLLVRPPLYEFAWPHRCSQSEKRESKNACGLGFAWGPAACGCLLHLQLPACFGADRRMAHRVDHSCLCGTYRVVTL